MAVVLQLDDDLAAAALALDLLDGIGAGAVAGPDMTGGVRAPGVGVNLDGFGDHEGGVETNAELADEVGVFLTALAHDFEEGLGAGVGDSTEVFDELIAGHAETGVLDGEGVGGVIGCEIDGELDVGVVDGLFRNLEVAEFFEGVRAIGDKLAHEDLLLGVEGVDDDIEQLLNLGLELVGFGHGRGGHDKFKEDV